MSENESGFYKLKDDVQQAFLFMDEVTQLVVSPYPSRAKIEIKHLIEFRDQVKEALGLGKLSNDATIGEIHNLKTERSYYRGILDHLCDRLQLWANGFERLKDVRIVKTSEPENLAIDNRRPCSFSRRVNVLLDDNPDEILTVLGDDQMLARIEKMYNDLTVANEFRDQVKFLFGEGLSDDETIAAIKARRWDQNQSNRFVMAIKAVLNQGKLSDDEAIAEIKRLQANQNRSDKIILDRLAEQEEFEKAPRYDPQEVSEICDDSDHKSAKDREIERLNRCLSEIVDILNRANTECLDHYRSKQEEKIVLTGFRRLCDIHAALFKKRSEYEIYGSRIINDLLNSVNLQAQKHAYDQEEIKFRSQIKQALYEGVRKDKYPSIDEFPDDDAISFVEHLIDRHKHWGRDHEFTQFALEVKQLLIDSVGKDISNEEAIAEIKRLQANQNRFDSATYDPFQDKYKLENIEHAISFRATVASYLGCSYDRNEAIAKIEQLTGDKDREIERLNRCISGIASFLDLPSDAKQPDICFAIMELRQKYKKISREPSSHEQIVIVDWIARLVGK
jgi:hypothetical protein